MTAYSKIRLWILTAVVLCLVPVPQSFANRAEEYHLKTAYLYRLSDYIEWPEPLRTNRIVIGILDYEPYREAVINKFAGTTNNPACTFVDVDTPEQARDCHILFLNTTDRAILADYLAALNKVPVLIVTDLRSGARLGAAINFFTIDAKIRFAINQAAAEEAGLSISSRLLRLGQVVKGATTEGEQP